MSGTMPHDLRVFVNERGVSVPFGSDAATAVRAFDDALADAIAAGEARLTDSRGLPVDATTPVHGGAIFRVIGGRREAAAVPQIPWEVLRTLPKAELHLHLDGSLRPGTLAELAAQAGTSLPSTDPAALAAWMLVDDAKQLEDYLARFAITTGVMQTADAIERVAYELVHDVAADGTWYVETRYAPSLSTRGGLSMDDVMAAWWRGLQRGERETGTIARMIVCALRGDSVAMAQAHAELAVAWADRGVVAFDLAAGEAGNRASKYREAFAHASAHDLAVTCHAGEGWGAASIREAIHDCGANRIGHGTRLHEDPELERYVADRRIALEVCPTSNVQTRVVSRFAEHPIKRYHALGIPVTLNTDNRLMSGVTLTDEYASAARHLGWSLATLAEVSKTAFDVAFLPWSERRALIARATDALSAHVSTHGTA
ncbi:MAG: adenosine deaminase [Gemmatimonadaceae bacterium]|jgi:adenosine deaminase|nr:adenosine deaminase [Gemmatimonadaceae bacterium]